MRNNKGSVVIEMCFIAPILIGIVFVIINMFFLLIKTGAATDEAYVAVYEVDEGADESISYGITGEGECTEEAAYTLKPVGTVQFSGLKSISGKMKAGRKVRDVSDELRRWQIYGGLLSD